MWAGVRRTHLRTVLGLLERAAADPVVATLNVGK
jgi:hypothetical protein